MNAAILLITHRDFGKNLRAIAEDILGHAIDNCTVVDVENGSDTDLVRACAEDAAKTLDNGNGLLILTDIYGATPANIACGLIDKPARQLITGVNLPMLLKAVTYRHLPLEQLTGKVIDGGRSSIIEACAERRPLSP